MVFILYSAKHVITYMYKVSWLQVTGKGCQMNMCLTCRPKVREMEYEAVCTCMLHMHVHVHVYNIMAAGGW